MYDVYIGLLAGLILASAVVSLDNGLARTPPMGWMAWERFRCNIDCVNDPENCIGEKLFMDMADRMAADGYRDAGYLYVSIDDCWMTKERDANGRLQADPKRFPRGIKFLADYLHDKGLRLGIYEDFGTKTCGGYPGSEFYLSIDAQTFSDWGVDMLKLDGCYGHYDDMTTGYPLMEFFLNQTGRPILYACSWPAYHGSSPINYPLIAKYCNMWRNFDDIQDAWSSMYSIVNYYGDNKGNFTAVAGPGNWNDPDELIIGDFSLSYEQEKVQFGMWAMMASPLFMSVDLRNIRSSSRDLLLNKRVLAINQDPLGIQGFRILKEKDIELWQRQLKGGSYAIAAINSGTYGMPTKISISLASTTIDFTKVGAYNLTETFDGKPLGIFKQQDAINLTIPCSSMFLATAHPVSSKFFNI